MTKGPGKYDEFCTMVREETKAKAVVLIVIEGSKGSGFSVQHTPDGSVALSKLLRTVADDLDDEGEQP